MGYAALPGSGWNEWPSRREWISRPRAAPGSSHDTVPVGGRLMTDLKGKKALVTGASRGIGRAIALRLAEAGADVAITYRENKALAADVVAEIERGGAQARAYAIDLADVEALEDRVAAIIAEAGGPDIVVNNDPQWFRGHQRRAEALIKMPGRKAEALAAMQKAVELAPEDQRRTGLLMLEEMKRTPEVVARQ